MATSDFIQRWGTSEERVNRAIAEAIVADNAGNRKGIQHALAGLMIAIPPSGHSCPNCNQPGEMYCPTVAIDRFRGLR